MPLHINAGVQFALHATQERNVQKPEDPKPQDKKSMSAADAAKLVKRRVVTVKDGEESVTFKPVGAKEVLAFRDCGSHVVVVTTDGQKFSSAEAEAEAA
jgi:hypothetical protein